MITGQFILGHLFPPVTIVRAALSYADTSRLNYTEEEKAELRAEKINRIMRRIIGAITGVAHALNAPCDISRSLLRYIVRFDN